MTGAASHPLDQWVAESASLLDLGCGRGEILLQMQSSKQCRCFGVEIDSDAIAFCMQAGLNMLQADINRDLNLFGDQSFDLVLAKDILHYAQSPAEMLKQMLRIGRQVVVAFDNYGWWRRRLHFMLSGSYKTEQQKGQSVWYRQQSFNLFSVADFEDLCRTQGCRVVSASHYPKTPGLPANMFCHSAWYLLQAS